MAASNRHVTDSINSVSRVMRKVHIFSAMPVLVLMLFFAITGIYLNHPNLKSGKVGKSQQTLDLPLWIINLENWPERYSSHSLVLLHWLDTNHGISGVDFEIEWDDMDKLVIINLSSPKGSQLVQAYLDDEVALVDTRELSFIAMLNNVHRAKHVSGFWRLLSDISAFCMVLFCLSGFWLVLINRFERKNANITLVLGSSLFVFVVVLMH